MRRLPCCRLADQLAGDEATGARAVAKSLETPLKQIAENAGLEGGVVVDKVRSLKGANGLNAATGEYEDLVKIGVIDAAKVTRSALQNAASIAALFLTTRPSSPTSPRRKPRRCPAAADGRLLDPQGGKGNPSPLEPPNRVSKGRAASCPAFALKSLASVSCASRFARGGTSGSPLPLLVGGGCIS